MCTIKLVAYQRPQVILSLKLGDRAHLAVIRKLFDDLARGSYGRVARAKALVHTTEGPYRSDINYGKIDYVRFDRKVAEGRLVIIGEALDQQLLEHAVRSRM